MIITAGILRSYSFIIFDILASAVSQIDQQSLCSLFVFEFSQPECIEDNIRMYSVYVWRSSIYEYELHIASGASKHQSIISEEYEK